MAAARVAVIVPTTGAPTLRQAVDSVLAQTHPDTFAYVVVDGPEHALAAAAALEGVAAGRVLVCSLPQNVGGAGFYGHRIYAAFVHLVADARYVAFLDEDNWLEPEHVRTCLDAIAAGDLQWVHSLRAICSENAERVCLDDCESLGRWPTFQGKHLVDTNCYFLPIGAAIATANAFHGGWGRDRVLFSRLAERFPGYGCTGRYTVNYRMKNDAVARWEFFRGGNAAMAERYVFSGGAFPWRGIF